MDLREMVSVARSGIENLRPAEVLAELDDENVLVVDVREPAEAESGSIAGALLVPRGMLELCADSAAVGHRAEMDPRRRTILCSGTGLRSALAGHTLQSMGYADVAHLEGGLEAWVAAGFVLA